MSNQERVLVTGASGFLGSELLKELEARLFDVVSLTKRGADRSGSIVGDITQPGDWQDEVRTGSFTHVFHLAGCNKADDSSDFYKVNVEGTKNLFDALKGSSVSWVLVTSSGAVYGKQPDDLFPIRETISPEPLGDYAVSKLQQENVATALSKDVAVKKLCIVRISNLIGPGSSDEFFLGRLIKEIKKLSPRKNVAAPTLELGSLEATRDFIDVIDAAGALVELMRAAAHGSFNLGSGVEYNLRKVVDIALKLGNMENARIVEKKSIVASPIRRQVLDIKKIGKITGWKPRVEIESSLENMFQF